jgi:UDP-3-O-[3-hydroxymyristoyl] glucosamine N-acyltransferase
VDAGAAIGAGSVIQAACVIGAGSVLGEGCFLYPRVTLYPGMKLGKRVMIHSGAVIGADGFGYKFRGGAHVKVPHVGWVEIGDDVEIGANSCIDRGTLGATRIGAGTKIDNLVQVAHNNQVGKHCILCGQVALAGSCTLEDYVVLGGNVGLADHSTMGRGARAGAKAGIAGHIPAGQEVWGLMATEKRVAFRSYAALRNLPELVSRVKDLEAKLAAVEANAAKVK